MLSPENEGEREFTVYNKSEKQKLFKVRNKSVFLFFVSQNFILLIVAKTLSMTLHWTVHQQPLIRIGDNIVIAMFNENVPMENVICSNLWTLISVLNLINDTLVFLIWLHRFNNIINRSS